MLAKPTVDRVSRSPITGRKDGESSVAKNIEYTDDKEASDGLRKRLVVAIDPIGDGMAVNKFVYVATATDMQNGDEALTWGSWDRRDGEGLARWDIHGMLGYTLQRLRIVSVDEEEHLGLGPD